MLGPTAHIPHNPQWHTIIFSLLLLFKIELYTLASWHRARSALIPFSFYSTISSIHLLYSFKREISPSWESRNEWQIEIWVTTILAPLHHTLRLLAPLFSLLNNNSREKTIHTPLYPFLGTPEMSDKLRYEWRLYLHTFIASFAFSAPLFSLFSYRSREKTIYTIIPLPGNSRNEWQIEIWVTNHFKILSPYYTWSPSWTTCYQPTQNNPFGETNNSTSSIALDDPSSISTKLLCIFAHTTIPTSFLILLLYNAHPELSNTTMTITREKRILIWLLINYLIKLTN